MHIAQIGNPVLRNIAQTVNKANDSEIVKLANNLITTAEAANGVGIAAPQVAQSYRLFIMASRPSIRYPHAPKMSPTAVINPVILGHSDEIIKDWEGCLSVPNVRGLVPRYKTVEVEYTDINGERKQRVLTDFVARIFQHELDHLDGILFIDRVQTIKDLYTEEEYQKIILD
ncbi:Peptide deformylase 2 [Hyella patelloides LEGE 07179]|uniref:Peptide deformylase n=1 Tax=Hyella patelloides LEGE 07179 TaxID=945734 RepID=A0A563VWQ9_9CYAN|nr:peptide deformylase [Hyella patelloides]VEP15892.1 Peptide deformylase 2 [Hyella patelloides LEGE 07179]